MKARKPKVAYPSVDSLQKVLAKNVFHYAKDAKKPLAGL
jgi:hypothetical protein